MNPYEKILNFFFQGSSDAIYSYCVIEAPQTYKWNFSRSSNIPSAKPVIAEDSAISPNNELQDPSLGNAFARQVLQYCEDNKLPTDNIFLYAMQERPSKLNLDLFLRGIKFNKERYKVKEKVFFQFLMNLKRVWC